MLELGRLLSRDGGESGRNKSIQGAAHDFFLMSKYARRKNYIIKYGTPSRYTTLITNWQPRCHGVATASLNYGGSPA